MEGNRSAKTEGVVGMERERASEKIYQAIRWYAAIIPQRPQGRAGQTHMRTRGSPGQSKALKPLPVPKTHPVLRRQPVVPLPPQHPPSDARRPGLHRREIHDAPAQARHRLQRLQRLPPRLLDAAIVQQQRQVLQNAAEPERCERVRARISDPGIVREVEGQDLQPRGSAQSPRKRVRRAAVGAGVLQLENEGLQGGRAAQCCKSTAPTSTQRCVSQTWRMSETDMARESERERGREGEREREREGG